jgi:hypothetical protein
MMNRGREKRNREKRKIRGHCLRGMMSWGRRLLCNCPAGCHEFKTDDSNASEKFKPESREI